MNARVALAAAIGLLLLALAGAWVDAARPCVATNLALKQAEGDGAITVALRICGKVSACLPAVLLCLRYVRLGNFLRESHADLAPGTKEILR